MKKVGIIGIGYIGKIFINSVSKNKNFELVILCDLSGEVIKKYENSKYILLTDYKTIINYDIDSVIITTPNYTHYKIIDYFLDNNIDVLCEKPLTLDFNSTKKLLEKARKKNLILMTAFHRRYNKNYIELRKSINNKKINIIYIRYLEDISEHTFGENWYSDVKKSGGGCIIDNGINVFDIVYNIVGDYQFIDANVGIKESDFGFYDENAFIELTFDGGKVYIELDWGYNLGESKDISVLTNESIYRCNMLDGYDKFKESLKHEYDGIVKDFYHIITKKRNYYDYSVLNGIKLVGDIYKNIY